MSMTTLPLGASLTRGSPDMTPAPLLPEPAGYRKADPRHAGGQTDSEQVLEDRWRDAP